MMKKGSFHEYAYSVGDEEGLVITGYSGNKTRPAIPKKMNGAKVTGIGNSVFYGCHSLITAKIPKSVSSIGNSAFYGCHSLITAKIPKSVSNIGNSAFSNCRSLSKITIPEHVSHIGIFAFNGCRNLTDITVDKRNSTYDSRDHCNAIIATKTNQLIVGCCNQTAYPLLATAPFLAAAT